MSEFSFLTDFRPQIKKSLKKAYGLSVQKACHSFSQCMGNSFRQTVAGIFSDRRMNGDVMLPSQSLLRQRERRPARATT